MYTDIHLVRQLGRAMIADFYREFCPFIASAHIPAMQFAELGACSGLDSTPVSVQQAAEFVPNVGPTLPENVTGELDLTQCLNGPLENATAASRGLVYEPACKNFFSNASQVAVGVPVTATVVPPILSPPAAAALGR